MNIPVFGYDYTIINIINTTITNIVLTINANVTMLLKC